MYQATPPTKKATTMAVLRPLAAGFAAALLALPLAAAASDHKPAAESRPAAEPKAATEAKAPAAEHKAAPEAKAPAAAEAKTTTEPRPAAEAKVAAEPKALSARRPVDTAAVAAAVSRAIARASAQRRIPESTRQAALAAVSARSGDVAAAAPAPERADHPPHWSYEGATGPHAWAKLAPEYAACGRGERQSPIDLRDGLKVDLEPIAFEYRPSGFKVVDNGHTIQVDVNGWNSMRVMGRQFRLVQFHFHRPSEETVDGRQFEMVAHLVHQDTQGRLAVVAVLIEKGARQPVLQTVLNNLPLEKGPQASVAGGGIDLAQMLPKDRRYFTYMGSLTTPPCTEDVLWIVMKQPVQATGEQLELFARLYPMNARPVQEARGRVVKESN